MSKPVVEIVFGMWRSCLKKDQVYDRFDDNFPSRMSCWSRTTSLLCSSERNTRSIHAGNMGAGGRWTGVELEGDGPVT